MQILFFMWRMIYLIDELAKPHDKVHNRLYSGARLHSVREGPDSKMLLVFGSITTCWPGLRYVTSRVMCSVFTPKLCWAWTKPHANKSNRAASYKKQNKMLPPFRTIHFEKVSKYILFLSTVELKYCENIQLLFNINYTVILILNELIISKSLQYFMDSLKTFK